MRINKIIIIYLLILVISCLIVSPVFALTTSITTETGTLDSGSLVDVLTRYDNLSYNVSEVSGVPGFDIRVNFTSVTTEFISISTSYYYIGGSGHTVSVNLYNYSSASWDTYLSLVETNQFIDKTVLVSDYIDYVSSGLVQLSFNHSATGNINHDMFIDYINLDVETVSSEWEDILIYGEMSWLFLLIFFGVAFLISWRVRGFALICMVACIFQAINYANQTPNLNHIWKIILLLVGACIFLFRLAGINLYKD